MGLRTCLVCDKKFLSEGPWNRICPTCNGRNLLVSGRPASTGGANETTEVFAEFLEER